MDAIYFLIPLTLLLLAGAIALFFWAVNSDQYSDLDKESQQILFDEKPTSLDTPTDKKE
ncbi:MAG: cbb3-type cytochrome oxidase assembly protein CcoS [Gammaproteobacteria bacterium]|nr:cbb3-type cytochrome oxidase assembly protein CcoS [Gammaproteobacteria bacterium]